jgi:hypothetical protein
VVEGENWVDEEGESAGAESSSSLRAESGASDVGSAESGSSLRSDTGVRREDPDINTDLLV